MLLIIKFLAKILAILNGEVSHRQIAAGFALGALIGLIPATGILPILLLLFSFIVNVNLAILFVASAIFKLLAFLIDPLANSVGYELLVNDSLKDFWTRLYNMPAVPFTKFNNTLVLGSFLIGVAALIPLYFLASWGVTRYRTKMRQRILQMKIVQVVKASSFYKYYLSFRGLTGE